MWMLAQHFSIIRASYRIRAELQQEARRFLERARHGRGRNVTFVGLHIRRGDYVNFIKNFHNCSLPGPEFYEAAINHYRASLADPLFVVTSDDLPHARHHLHRHPDVVFSDLRTAEGDMALLAACSHSIMTVGSFGFWSSFLAGGHVVYPLVNGCSKTPFMHPDSLGSRGFENWLPLMVESRGSDGS
ncbi:Galactoside 2-alpha-L-fucosyltransferase 2 [Portunus trituberculatus]|uniref:L-Fucosyltransferase n=2 Tax=Portunus trituberculatus TaxID=210409 RepID=A0A5B7ETA1_PORTR|nr:Galactoside 2-alpha-L-fucosyltransferase 2 [Portunus trituberculatus]